MPFDRLLAALVLMKCEAMICGIIIIKSSKDVFAQNISACWLLLLSQYMLCEYGYLLNVRQTPCCKANINNEASNESI